MTLIELLVTMSIVAILAGITVFNGGALRARADLNNSVQLVEQAIVQAQATAKAPPSALGKSFVTVILAPAGQVSVYANSTKEDGNEKLLEQKSLPSGVVLASDNKGSALANPLYISFRLDNPIRTVGDEISFYLYSAKVGSKHLTVLPSGAVNIE